MPIDDGFLCVDDRFIWLKRSLTGKPSQGIGGKWAIRCSTIGRFLGKAMLLRQASDSAPEFGVWIGYCEEKGPIQSEKVWSARNDDGTRKGGDWGGDPASHQSGICEEY